MPALNRRSVLLSVGLGLVLVAAAAGAEQRWRLPRPVPSYSVSLESPWGGPLPTFRHEGRTFVLGERGERYAIRVDNPTGERVEAVVSVDGRDAVSGEIGDYRTQRGYIIPPYGSVRIEGFRRSLDEVAAFRFSAPGASYSARRGTPENVGVIGVAFFRERRPAAKPERPIAEREPRPFPRRAAPEEPSHSDARGGGAAPKSKSDARESPAAAPTTEARKGRSPRDDYHYEPERDVNNLGTEYGERRESSVVEVPFTRRGTSPDRLATLRYDDAVGLERRGIDLGRGYDRSRYDDPEPFPRSRFAPPPP